MCELFGGEQFDAVFPRSRSTVRAWMNEEYEKHNNNNTKYPLPSDETVENGSIEDDFEGCDDNAGQNISGNTSDGDDSDDNGDDVGNTQRSRQAQADGYGEVLALIVCCFGRASIMCESIGAWLWLGLYKYWIG